MKYIERKQLKKQAAGFYATAYRKNNRAKKANVIVTALESSFENLVGFRNLALDNSQIQELKCSFQYVVNEGLEDFRVREQRHLPKDDELESLATKIVIETFVVPKTDLVVRIKDLLKREL